jgi:hypothetical protein
LAALRQDAAGLRDPERVRERAFTELARPVAPDVRCDAHIHGHDAPGDLEINQAQVAAARGMRT